MASFATGLADARALRRSGALRASSVALRGAVAALAVATAATAVILTAKTATRALRSAL